MISRKYLQVACTVHIFNPFCFCTDGGCHRICLDFSIAVSFFIMIIIMIIAEEKSKDSKKSLC